MTYYNEERKEARRAAIAALDNAKSSVARYMEYFASSEEIVDLGSLLPELRELGRRFEWETAPFDDDDD